MRRIVGCLVVCAAIVTCGGTIASAVEPAQIIVNPGAEFADDVRTWQGIPGVERALSGRLWVVWYTGGAFEGDVTNYALLATSGDDGKSWSPPRVTIQGKPGTRIGDPLPWLDPSGRLWLFYRQLTLDSTTNKAKWSGTCAIRTDEPDAAEPKWSEPFVVGEGGILFGKPIVRDGAWIAPFFLQGKGSPWGKQAQGRETSVITSMDEGRTWSWLGGTTVKPELLNFSEATLAARRDGSLWMVIRTKEGLHESESTDGGKTWSATKPMPQFVGPATRAHVRRLASGAFLLIYHGGERTSKGVFLRNRLTAWLSVNDGRTWPHRVMLDDRNRVSYPDATQAPDGRIYAAYDFGRYTPEQKQILLCIFREADVRNGKLDETAARAQILVNQATGAAAPTK